MGKMGIPLRQDEFDRAKDLLFKGEDKVDVAREIGRSLSLIVAIEKTNSLEEYRAYQRAQWDKPKKHEQPREVTVSPLPKNRYGRLRLFREKLDSVLIDFILSEIEENQKALVAENEQLKKENAQLKEDLEEGSSDSFVAKIKSHLQPEPVEVVKKTLLTFYRYHNGRYGHALEDVLTIIPAEKHQSFTDYINTKPKAFVGATQIVFTSDLAAFIGGTIDARAKPESNGHVIDQAATIQAAA